MLLENARVPCSTATISTRPRQLHSDEASLSPSLFLPFFIPFFDGCYRRTISVLEIASSPYPWRQLLHIPCSTAPLNYSL